jgi:hypothetical protein
MADSSKVWRRRLHRALLDELISQEMRSGKSLAIARALAERRLAAAVFKSEHGAPPDPDEWSDEVRESLQEPDDDEDWHPGAEEGSE